MAKYSYTKKTPKNPESWIDCLQLVSPVATASSNYTEIHFTQPKSAEVAKMARPHVTFVSGVGTTHWYLVPKEGKWVPELGGKFTDRAQVGEGEIAQNVTNDAVSLDFIRAPASSKQVDDDGFTTVESRGNRKARVATSWQK